MYRVDLNSDMGESFGAYRIGCDEEVIKYITAANVACGWHGGDPMVMEKTVALAKKCGTEIDGIPIARAVSTPDFIVAVAVSDCGSFRPAIKPCPPRSFKASDTICK